MITDEQRAKAQQVIARLQSKEGKEMFNKRLPELLAQLNRAKQ